MSADPYPPEFNYWSLEERNAWCAKDLSASPPKPANGAAAIAKPQPIEVDRGKTFIGAAWHDPTRPAVVTLKRASELKAIPISWVWPSWIARGKAHIIGGQPGAGKTTLAMRFAATVTTGGRQADGATAARGNVVVWSGEDDPADTLVPRLSASGADLDRVFFVEGVLEGKEAVRSIPQSTSCLSGRPSKPLAGLSWSWLTQSCPRGR